MLRIGFVHPSFLSVSYAAVIRRASGFSVDGQTRRVHTVHRLVVVYSLAADVENAAGGRAFTSEYCQRPGTARRAPIGSNCPKIVAGVTGIAESGSKRAHRSHVVANLKR
jgi:hypothetical protein